MVPSTPFQCDTNLLMTRKETDKVIENCQTFHSRLSAIRGKVSDHVLAMGKVCSKVQKDANARPEVPG